MQVLLVEITDPTTAIVATPADAQSTSKSPKPKLHQWHARVFHVPAYLLGVVAVADAIIPTSSTWPTRR